MKRGFLAVVLLFLATGALWACRATVWFRDGTQTGPAERVWVSDQQPQTVPVEIPVVQGTVCVLSVVIEVTDCTAIRFDLKIAGKEWDNEVYPLPLQPMNKLIWREQGMKLVAEGIFRAAGTGTYEITARYSDEQAKKREMVLRFVVAPAPGS